RRLHPDVPCHGKRLPEQGRNLRPGVQRCTRHLHRPDAGDARNRAGGLHDAGGRRGGGVPCGESSGRCALPTVRDRGPGGRGRLPGRRACSRGPGSGRLRAALRDVCAWVSVALGATRKTRGDEVTMRRLVPALSLIAALLVARPLLAEQAAAPASGNEESNTELAKKTQNPVADLISVPFQNNFNFNTGPENRTVWVLNVQPVIPIHLTDHWNLITRIIMPIINLPSLAPGIDHAFGLGDINPTFFLSPVGSEKFIWGAGPTFTFPTASNRLLGSGKYSAGPAAVALTMQGPWVVGALLNNQWSFAGWGKDEFNQLLLQPFVNYNFGKGWYLLSSPILTANWDAAKGNQWTVPLGMGAGKLFRLRELPGGDNLGELGKLPVNVSLD